MIEKTTFDGALATYLEASKQGSELVKPLELWLMKQPRDSSRSTALLHPSEVASVDWCPRHAQEVMEGLVVPAGDTHRFRMQNIFAEGHAIHDKWQTWLGEMGALYGVWECRICEAKDWHQGIPTALCKHGDRCLKYQEVPLSIGVWQGHADGIVTLAGKSRLLEIKSIGTGTIRVSDPSLISGGVDLGTAFRGITHPFESHRKQIQIYMYLANLLHDVRPDVYMPIKEAIVIYECKSNQDVKEFVVPYDPGSISFILNYVEKIDRHLGSGTLVECPHDDGECRYSHE